MHGMLNKLREYLQRVNRRKHTYYDYISWLRFANAGMLDEGNLYCFEYAVRNLHSAKPVIEIGSFCGLSTNLINFYLQMFSKTNKIITCDKWIFEGGENPEAFLPGSSINHKDYKKFVKETFMRNVSFFSKNNLPYTIEVFSDDFFRMWENGIKSNDVFGRDIQLGGDISFAFIDGNHEYEFAKRDFINSDKYLEIGGFILFDDSSDFSSWGVNKVIEEVKQTKRYEVVIKNPNYLFKKIK